MKKIALIGSTSFLGKSIADQLNKTDIHLHHFSRIRSNESINWNYYNYPSRSLDYDFISDFDTVIYCAGAGIQPKNKDSKEKIYGLNLFEPMRLINELEQRSYKGHIITFGSYFEIGNSNTEKLYTEEELVNHSNILPNDYCISKHLLSQFIYQKIAKGNRISHLIITNLYGVGENAERLIPYIVRSVKNGESLSFTSGTQMRQFVQVREMAKTVLKCIESTPTGVFNITNPKLYSIKDVISLTIKLMKEEGYKIPTISFGEMDRKDLSMRFLGLDITKSLQVLELETTISLEQGISEYIK